MEAVFRTLRKVSPFDLSVLFTGPSGVGKTFLAKALHAHSPRADGPLVVFECGGTPDTLIESELFGHTEGAFTGAIQARLGAFRAAHEGTLILDEIGAASPALQVALLRVLEEDRVTPLGATHSIPVDTRVLATTSTNLKELVDQGTFRSDLFYRLAVVILPVPSLRERTEDIALLAHNIVEQLRHTWKLPLLALSDSARRNLEQRRWPGNIRELENALKRAAALAGNEEILAEHLPLPPSLSFDAVRQGEALDDQWIRRGSIAIHRDAYAFPSLRDQLEALTIDRALEACDGNQSEAAKLLDMPRRTLVHKLRERRQTHGSSEAAVEPEQIGGTHPQILDRRETQKGTKGESSS